MDVMVRNAGGSGEDSSSTPLLADLEAGLHALPRLPPDSGRLALIVRRESPGARDMPDRVLLTVEDGVPGGGPGRIPVRSPEAQIAVMRRDVAELIAHGKPLTRFGDDLFVDFDISAANLPAGARLRVGEALVEVTAKPHNGCGKFHARFGADALRFVNAKSTRHLNLRGIYWKVVEPGEAGVGAAIRLVSRPGAAAHVSEGSPAR